VSEERTYKFGIVGCGVIAPWHAEAIARTEGAELVAVCDIDRARAEALAEKYGVTEVYTDYEKMMEREDLDIVNICVYSGRHAEVGIAAAQAGKHILCEKPIDITLERIDALINAADEAGVKLGVIFQRRTSPHSCVVKEAIAQGKLGHLILCDTYLKYHRSHEYYASAGWRGTWELDGGGCLMNQGVHGIDLLQWLVGVPVTSVFGRTGTLARNIEVEDTAVAVLTFRNGALGVIEGTTSLVAPGLPTRHDLHGERGTIVLTDKGIERWDVEGEEGQIPQVEAETVGGTADPRAIGMRGHILQVQDMVAAVRENRDPMVPGREARKAVEIILAIYRSAQTGEVVTLPLK